MRGDVLDGLLEKAKRHDVYWEIYIKSELKARKCSKKKLLIQFAQEIDKLTKKVEALTPPGEITVGERYINDKKEQNDEQM